MCSENFEILHGDGHHLPDTVAFLKSLSRLAEITGKSSEKTQSREWLAAATLFNWEVYIIIKLNFFRRFFIENVYENLLIRIICFQDEIFLSRAPGRLDVMGGIGDYSGSLVLQVNLHIPEFHL